MRGLGPLHARHRRPIETPPAHFVVRRPTRISVVETAVGAAIDEIGAVEVRDQAGDVEGRDGVEGVVCGTHFGEAGALVRLDLGYW